MISVILPVYNGEKYLREAIGSILNQTFKKIELILLDDNSSDSSWDIIKSYADCRIIAHRLTHCGIPKILNYGLKIAKYDYVAIMNQDDISNLFRFEKQIDYLKKYPNVDILGTNIIYLFEKDKSQKLCKYPSLDNLIKLHLPYTCCIAHPTLIYKKKTIISSGGYNEEYKIASDWDLYLRIRKNVTFHNLQEGLLYYRIHDKNYSGNSNLLELENEKIVYNHFDNEVNNSKNIKKNYARAYFNIGYYFYLKDKMDYKKYFIMALKYDKMNMRYLYFYIIGIYLRTTVLFFRKFGLIKFLKPIKKLDEKNLFFRPHY